MYIIKFYDNIIVPQENLIIDYSLLAPSLTIARYYFYIKIFYILLIVGLYLCLIFLPSAPYDNNSGEPKQATLNKLNGLIKEYAHLLLILASVKTADMQFETAKLQAETAKYQNNAEEAKVSFEEAQASVEKVRIGFSNVRNVSEAVRTKLDRAKARTDSIDNNLKEIWDTRNSFMQVKNNQKFESDPVIKAKLDSEADILLAKAVRLLKEQQEGINNSIKDINDSIDIIDTAAISDQNLPSPLTTDGGKGSSSSTALKTIEDGKEEVNLNSTTDKVNINDSDIKKSSIIDFDSLNQWVDELNLIKRIAFTMLLGNSLILSIVINILFIQFGDQFISRFKLEERFPRVKKILEYRKKFQKFYMLNGAFIIIVTTLTFITFAIKILIA